MERDIAKYNFMYMYLVGDPYFIYVNISINSYFI